MDFQRILLYVALSLTMLMMWEAWQVDYVRPPKTATTQQSNITTGDIPGAPAVSNATPGMTSGTTPNMTSGSASLPDPQIATAAAKMKSAQRIHVTTDLLDIEIDTIGGDIRTARLLAYPTVLHATDDPFVLLNDQGEIHVAQSGLLSSGSDQVTLPTHHDIFSSSANSYTLKEGEDQLEVRLEWQNDSGFKVSKIYTFKRDSYVIQLDQEVNNQSSQNWRGHAYQQLLRQRPAEGSNMFMYTYTGGVLYSELEKYEKIPFEDMEKVNLKQEVENSWVAMIQHYFFSAWIPAERGKVQAYSKTPGNNLFIIGIVDALKEVAAGSHERFSSTLYVGPKLPQRMIPVAKGLELTVDYGLLTVIAEPLDWLLALFNSMLGNWGWSIIFLTLLIKLAFFKLSETSYKSMAHMRKMQPKMVAMKERYGDDRTALNQAMMKLYKEEKINPLGGCLPILLQMPVFIALYWMLMENVEMRQAPFMFWIQDLAAADPYFILPLIMGATMILQMRLNPTPMDPIQAKVMMVLPVVFTFFFAFFPSGLVLYWVVNNILSISQQWYITKRIIQE
ncbi:MAG: membrane protein insertase YidC [Gammaproteobacteria bacterium]|nr:membrane protein insertase YidC [Gammaproteobacteria bacterium]